MSNSSATGSVFCTFGLVRRVLCRCWLLRALDPARKLLVNSLPVSWVHGLSVLLTTLLWLLLQCGLNKIAYFRQFRTFTLPHLRSIVFDQMLPRIANYWRRDEVDALMRGAGLVDVELTWVNEMSWAAKGRKPA